MFITKKKLEQQLQKAGCERVRRGGKHDIWRAPNGKNFPISHAGVKSKVTYKKIMKQAGIES